MAKQQAELNSKITNTQRQSFIGVAIGTLIEYYDYALFALFLPIIAPQFFPGDTAYDSLYHGYQILMIAMIARPFGGAIFGHIGDFIGRRHALLLSMYGIAVTTLIIGLTPTYHSIGVFAIMIIVIAKAIQIACFGGEYNGAGIYVVEHAKQHQEGLVGSLLTAIISTGSLIASLLGILLTMDGMPDWSWRIAFFLGGLIGVFGVLYRKKMVEPANFKPAQRSVHNLWTLCRQFPKQMLAGVFIGGFATIPFSTIIVFINPVLMTQGYITSQQLMLLQCVMIAVGTIILITAGLLADRFSPRKIIQSGAIALALFSIPLLMLIEHRKFIPLVMAQLAMIAINEIILGPSNAYLKRLFPSEFRYRGSSISFTLGMALLGGATPLIENSLYNATGSFTSSAYWLVFIGLGTFITVMLANDASVSHHSHTRNPPLDTLLPL